MLEAYPLTSRPPAVSLQNGLYLPFTPTWATRSISYHITSPHRPIQDEHFEAPCPIQPRHFAFTVPESPKHPRLPNPAFPERGERRSPYRPDMTLPNSPSPAVRLTLIAPRDFRWVSTTFTQYKKGGTLNSVLHHPSPFDVSDIDLQGSL